MTLRLNGSTSGYTEIDAPAVAGSNTLVLPSGNGSNGQALQTNGSGVLSWGPGVSNDGQLCKAWVNFNGTGTVAIRAAYNVSSITDNGTGDYTVNFTTAMSDANYSASLNAQWTADLGTNDSVNAGCIIGRLSTAVQAGSLRCKFREWGGSDQDPVRYLVAIFR